MAPRGRTEPQRTCVVCRVPAAKRRLHRIVRAPDGRVEYDPTGRAPGRGAYLCGRPGCLELARRRPAVQRALKVAEPDARAAIEALRGALATMEGGAQQEQAAPRAGSLERQEEVSAG